MGWHREELLHPDQVPANTRCNCCLMTLVVGMIGTGVMLKMYYANYL